MKISDYRQFELEFNCRDAGELLFLYVLDRGDLSLDERWAIERHLETCADCQREHDESKFVNDALIANRDYLIAEGVFEEPGPEAKFKRVSDEEADFLQFQAKIQRAIARRKRDESQNKPAISRFAIKIASAVAACLIISLGIWSILSIYNPDEASTQQQIAGNSTEIPVKIELLRDAGIENIPPGQPIIAKSQLKTLRINDNRQMILNTGTKLSILPHNLGCIVKLDKGEIYTEVEHDGKPFIVETTHGRAVITGTTFNIKADDKLMELAVVEGTVRFENDKGIANVTAGYKSFSALNTEPALPVQCDTIKLTVWAMGLDNPQKIAANVYQPEIELCLAFGNEQINLERIDYTSWIEQKRYWFKREFPHIFRFKEALAKEGIEADYPELLVKSGDLWRFAYPEQTRTRLVPASYESMIKLASAYGKNELWLSDNLQIIRENLTSENKISVLKAFDRWTDALEEFSDSQSEISSELLTYSLHASVYLYKTRTLLWLAVNNNKIAVTAIEKKRTAVLLEQQIKAANDCVTKFKEMFACGYSPNICDDCKQQDLLQSIVDIIENVRTNEINLEKHNVFK